MNTPKHEKTHVGVIAGCALIKSNPKKYVEMDKKQVI